MVPIGSLLVLGLVFKVFASILLDFLLILWLRAIGNSMPFLAAVETSLLWQSGLVCLEDG
jgi:hypothetical protein